MSLSRFTFLEISRIPQSELHPLAAVLDDGYPDIWKGIAEHLYLVLRSSPQLSGVDAEALAHIALAQTYQFAQEFGGDTIYVGKGSFLAAQERKAGIVADFTGTNYKEVAKKYGVSISRVRQVLREYGRSKGPVVRR